MLETLFIGQNLIRLPICDSTNTVLANLSTQNNFLAEGTTLITQHQTAGRGQRGNVWEAKAGENLTFSVLLKPSFLAISNIFALNIFVALAVRKALSEVFFEKMGEIFIENPTENPFLNEIFKNNENDFKVKWANDILYKNQKIAGILIENTLKGTHIAQSIVGIGININQMIFDTPTATSLLKITNDYKTTYQEIITNEGFTKKMAQDFTYILEYILHKVLKHLEYYYLCMKKSDFLAQKEEYFAHLFQYNIWAKYKLPNEDIFFGKITQITKEGYLEMEIKNELETTEKPKIGRFGLKEITFLY